MSVVALAVAAGSASAAWSAPFDLVKPGSMDYLPAQLAFSPTGSAAAAFAIGDVDTPGSSQAYLVVRAASGAISAPWTIPRASEILSLAFDGSGLEMLTGTTSSGLDCCSSAQAVRLTVNGTLQAPQTLVGGLEGATLGQLVKLADNRMVAAVATEQAVWTVESNRAGRFSGQRRLTEAGQTPMALSATWLGGQGSLLAWTSATGPPGSADPRTIYYATGSSTTRPTTAKALLRIAAGHRIDELAVARRKSGATAAWTESWYDRRGTYHSQIRAADFGVRPSIRSLSAASGQASSISFASDAAGAQAIAWETCTSAQLCTVRVATRPPKGGFGFPVALGSIDPTQEPSLAVSPSGQVVVGWVRGGNPVAAVGSASSGRFGPVQVLSQSAFALDLTVAFGHHQALAAWTQGTLGPSVVGAVYGG